MRGEEEENATSGEVSLETHIKRGPFCISMILLAKQQKWFVSSGGFPFRRTKPHFFCTRSKRLATVRLSAILVRLAFPALPIAPAIAQFVLIFDYYIFFQLLSYLLQFNRVSQKCSSPFFCNGNSITTFVLARICCVVIAHSS